jgi:hypothetical protein
VFSNTFLCCATKNNAGETIAEEFAAPRLRRRARSGQAPRTMNLRLRPRQWRHGEPAQEVPLTGVAFVYRHRLGMGDGGIAVETVRAVAINGLIERDRAPRLSLSKQWRAVLCPQYFDCSECGAFGSARLTESANDSRKHLVRTAGGREAEEQTLTDRLY